MARLRLKRGDLFTIPLAEIGRLGVGQIVDKSTSSIYVAVYDYSVREEESVDAASAVQSAVVALSPTMDGRLFHGMWKVVANQAPPSTIPYQAFKEAMFIDAEYHHHEVVNWSSKERRVATDFESVALPDRFAISPIVLEELVRWHFGLETWKEHWDKLLPDAATSLATVFPEALPR